MWWNNLWLVQRNRIKLGLLLRWERILRSKVRMIGKNNCSDVTGCRAQKTSNSWGKLLLSLTPINSEIWQVGCKKLQGNSEQRFWSRGKCHERCKRTSVLNIPNCGSVKKKTHVSLMSKREFNNTLLTLLRSPSDLPLVLKNVTNVSNGGFIETHQTIEWRGRSSIRSEDLLRVKSAPAEAAEVIPTVKKVLSDPQTSIKIADGFSNEIKKARSVHRAFRF